MRWVTMILAAAGVAIGVYAVATADEVAPPVPLAREASVNPFGRGIAALGIVEPLERSVDVAAPEAGLVVSVAAGVGERVAAGAELFRLDARQLEAQLLEARAEVAAREAEIARWHALPRGEDVPPAQAAAMAARARAADLADTLKRTEDAARAGAATTREVAAARFALERAEAERAQAEAELARVNAGGWKPDLVIAEANLGAARARVGALEALSERLTVRAPRAGTVLRREIEPGEYASAGGRTLLVLGDLEHLAVRAQVDEEDIGLLGGWKPGVKLGAVLKTRGARQRTVELELVRIEPYARPKSDLSGTNLERVDTRVVDVVLRVKAGELEAPLYPGQAVDVFIDAEGK